MELENYDTLLPEVGEDNKNYAFRLQELGYEEMFIRQALRYHFEMRLSELPTFFDDLELARLRHLTLLRKLFPKRSHSWMVKKVARGLGIPEQHAEQWVARHIETGDVAFIGIERLRAE